MKVIIKKLKDEAVIPTSGSAFAAGYDLYALTKDGWDEVIPPHGTIALGTGLSFEIPEGYFGAVFARSGLATKQGLRPANCVGVIDSDYRGEVIVALHNDTAKPKTIKNKDRVAQLVIMPYLKAEFELGETNDTNRGENGFGSTGR